MYVGPALLTCGRVNVIHTRALSAATHGLVCGLSAHSTLTTLFALVMRGAIIWAGAAHQKHIHALCTVGQALGICTECGRASLIAAKGLCHASTSHMAALGIRLSKEWGPRAHAGLNPLAPTRSPYSTRVGPRPICDGPDDIRGGPRSAYRSMDS